ncbi:MAG: tRNA (N6-isopentenyl adenosine(37)-C2)-methylthiotransferase MiaB [Chitinophagales bacterium]|nr:tRNA (N6-isopentenyl adenosine(37)-C2)-methylthiotransferase MiaB [Chitinophagales bacterium]
MMNQLAEEPSKLYFIESYGCQMNVNDSEIVAAILEELGYQSTKEEKEASLILLNTCSIRDKAEQTIRYRLKDFQKIKRKNKSLKVGILGCMAERLKTQLFEEEKLVDLVVGPDSYRALPSLLQELGLGQKAVNTLLSREETYGDIAPVRLNSNGVTAFVSIMRGCDNMCAFCVVPFTRGRERSRSHVSILQEVKDIVQKGYKEVTLLGQNVDSYRYSEDPTLKGKNLIDAKFDPRVINFSKLLEMVAQVSPDLRVRFSTSHPKDMTDDVLEVMSRYHNICKFIHLPVQSGSDTCLERMNRSYDSAIYMNRIDAIKRYMPNCALSSDFIAGFCGETEQEHQATLDLIKKVRYDMSFMFYYSERPGTIAARRYKDDVPLEVKKRRLSEIIALQNQIALEINQTQIGQEQVVLIEFVSKRSKDVYIARNDYNKKVAVPKKNYQVGDYVLVKITDATTMTLIAEDIRKLEHLSDIK